ncbi:MAG: sialate O-acetylesterase [Flavobacteriaceae bacterium]|jgi:sialate O-acetylesterase
MKTKTITQLFLFMLGVSFTCISQTNMPSFFSNNMILQQQENVAIWGTDAPGAIIEVHTSWGAEKVVKTKANGKLIFLQRKLLLKNKKSRFRAVQK